MKRGTVLAFAAFAVWIWHMQPADAQTIKSDVTINGVTYHSTTNVAPDGTINSTVTQGRPAPAATCARLDKLYNWLDTKCRGGNGDNPDTQTYCSLRDSIK